MSDPRVIEPEQVDGVALGVIRERARSGRRELNLTVGVLRDMSTYQCALRRELSEPPNRIHASMTPDAVGVLVLVPRAHAEE